MRTTPEVIRDLPYGLNFKTETQEPPVVVLGPERGRQRWLVPVVSAALLFASSAAVGYFGFDIFNMRALAEQVYKANSLVGNIELADWARQTIYPASEQWANFRNLIVSLGAATVFARAFHSAR